MDGGDGCVRKNRSLDGLPTGPVVSTFLTPSVSPKFCVRRNDEKGDVVTDVLLISSTEFSPVKQREIALLMENSEHILRNKKSRRSVDKPRRNSGEKAEIRFACFGLFELLHHSRW